MGITIDIPRGQVEVYLTCDTCGFPILGTAQIDPPNDVRDYARYQHLRECPDPDRQQLRKVEP